MTAPFRHGALALALGLGACTGNIGPSRGEHAQLEGAAGASSSPSDPQSSGGTGGASGSPGPSEPGAADVGHVPIHRLNNLEYDNTVRDLLGVSETPASAFIADEKAHGFDNIAAALGMTEAQYEQYFNAADAVVEAAFADPSLRARIVTCQLEDGSCTERILRDFGKRAYRRPLEDAELEPLEQLASDARALGEDHDGAIKQVVKAMLSSVPFLYRLELDPSPTSTAPRALDGYELASRLSYLVWSSMPDDALFAAADSGELSTDAGLSAQLERMLAHERAEMLAQSFGAQWLGLRDLRSHQVDADIFPEWSEDLRAAMIDEGLYFFGELLRGELPMTELFTADFHYVNGPLAELYGIEGVSGDSPRRVTDATDQRRGFLGLASFLTVTSFSYRTAPTLRGKWILENLLCQKILPPPANVPELEEDTGPGADLEALNVRERLAEHRDNPACASCHTLLDPMGLGLESFDAIGRFRSEYGPGEPVDSSGMLPTGESFSSLSELSTILARDARLYDCTTEKLMTYALSRALTEGDAPYVERIRERFVQGGASLRGLLEQIVLSEPFRSRRAEGEVAP